MRRIFSLIVITAVGTGALLYFNWPKTAQQKNVAETLGAVATATPTPAPSSSPSAAPAVPTTHATCSSISSKAASQTKTFMNTHQQKKAQQVLDMIRAPENDEDITQKNFLLGSDSPDGPRLYTLSQFAYSTESYRLGNIQQNGQDSEDRGAMRCTYTVYESRVYDSNSGHTEETVTRYVDFAVDDLGNIVLTAFRNALNGSKYSGFN